MSSKHEDLKRDRTQALLANDRHRFIQFKGAAMMSVPGSRGFVGFSERLFAKLCYDTFGMGLGKATIKDLQHSVETMAPDWSHTDHLIAFHDKVWDMRKLAWVEDELEFVYSTGLRVVSAQSAVDKVREYLLQLADGDPDLARDYVQAIAPLFMYRKPLGIVWFVGQGANGKSAFIDALYMIAGKHFADQSMDMIEDGRSAPSLRGILGNVVREASEKRIEDDKHYKNIGAHESFPIRVLGTHEVVQVDANFHTIMNANNAPVFEDKSMGSRRRTLLIPFPATFGDDPQFKDRTFTPDFLGALAYLALEETRHLRDKGYQWSAQTTALQDHYNNNANTAEAFARHMDEIGLMAFRTYRMLHINYQNWCTDNGMISLGMTHFVRAMENILGVAHQSSVAMIDGRNTRYYHRQGVDIDEVVWLDNGYGMGKPKEQLVQQDLGGVSYGW